MMYLIMEKLGEGKKTPRSIWGKQRLNSGWGLSFKLDVFEMMVEDGNIEVLKLLSSTSAQIAQGEDLQFTT